MDLAWRLKSFGVKVIATKRRWASSAQHSSEIRSIFLPYYRRLLLFNNISSLFYFLPSSTLFDEDDVDDLVDEKGTSEDIYDFAGKADIVVCCLILNSETVKPFPT